MDTRGGLGCSGENEPTPRRLNMYATLKLERSRAYEFDMIAEDSHDNKFELEIYLRDKSDSQVKDLNVLLWWKANTPK